MDDAGDPTQILVALMRIADALETISAELQRAERMEALVRSIDANVSDVRDAVLALG